MQHYLDLAHRLLKQEKTSKNKLYSFYEPEVDCIAKGKARQRYKFGAKVSISASSHGAWVLGAQAFHGNPYDGLKYPSQASCTFESSTGCIRLYRWQLQKP